MGESTASDKAKGESGEDQISIYTHKSFDINYNGDQVSDALTGITHLRGCSCWLHCSAVEVKYGRERKYQNLSSLNASIKPLSMRK